MISSLHVHNFKCFGDQDFPLKALTLLTGLNSTGKSSVSTIFIITSPILPEADLSRPCDAQRRSGEYWCWQGCAY